MRSQVQRLIQELLEEEVTAFLGRAKSALRSDSDNDTGYRNGYGRARRLTLSSGTIQLRQSAIPRSSSRAGCCRCSSTGPGRLPRVDPRAVPARSIRRRLRSGFAGAAGRGRTGIGEHGGPVEPSGTMSLPNGAAGPSMTWKWSTCGWMESTSRLVLRRRRRRYWW